MTLQAREILGSRKSTREDRGPSAPALRDSPWMMGALSWTTGCSSESFYFPKDGKMGEREKKPLLSTREDSCPVL